MVDQKDSELVVDYSASAAVKGGEGVLFLCVCSTSLLFYTVATLTFPPHLTSLHPIPIPHLHHSHTFHPPHTHR